jgi:nucleoside-diphosphate-sugar epimerase
MVVRHLSVLRRFCHWQTCLAWAAGGGDAGMMRITVLGGTEFIGRRTVERLVERGDQVQVVHRGRTEPADWVECEHLHIDRADFHTEAHRVRAFRPDAIVDTYALTKADVDATLPHLPDVPTVVLSSMDVYQVYELLLQGDPTPVTMPLDEHAELRYGRYPYRGRDFGSDLDDYEKLDVEPAYLRRGGTVLRLCRISGPYDGQRREELILRRVRAGRTRIPIGAAQNLVTRLHVDDAAAAVRAVLDRPAVAASEIFNIGEAASFEVRGWLRAILAAAGHDAELVLVPEHLLPDDMAPTRAAAQPHLLVSSRKATDRLDWRPMDAAGAVEASVRWHLANPPTDASTDFTADDRALAAA